MNFGVVQRLDVIKYGDGNNIWVMNITQSKQLLECFYGPDVGI